MSSAGLGPLARDVAQSQYHGLPHGPMPTSERESGRVSSLMRVPHSEVTHVPRPALVWQFVLRQRLTAQDGTGPLLDSSHLELPVVVPLFPSTVGLASAPIRGSGSIALGQLQTPEALAEE